MKELEMKRILVLFVVASVCYSLRIHSVQDCTFVLGASAESGLRAQLEARRAALRGSERMIDAMLVALRDHNEDREEANPEAAEQRVLIVVIVAAVNQQRQSRGQPPIYDLS